MLAFKNKINSSIPIDFLYFIKKFRVSNQTGLI